MRLAYFDCFAGAGGDMIVGALLDAGLDFAPLQAELAKLNLPGFEVGAEQAQRGGICGTRFRVEVAAGDQPHRGLADILTMLGTAGLPTRAADHAQRVFKRLAEAEAKVHRMDVEKVHFHEVGAIDSIVDVTAACVAVELLGIERVFCSAIPVGSGAVECEHGRLPAPAPATAELLVGATTTAGRMPGEVTTPTAAAVLTTLAESFGPPPTMDVSAVGYGAGTRTDGPLPNLLRVFLGQADDLGALDAAVELSANIDDCSGELIAAAIDRLLAAGCLDAWAAPIVMKKSRPAWTVACLCEPGDVDAAERILFRETTTFGIRRRPCRRSKLQREHVTVETKYGPIRIKIGRHAGRVVTASPEFADCLAAAEAHGASVKEVMVAARTARRGGGR